MKSMNPLILAKTLWDYLYIKQIFPSVDLIIGLGSYDLRVADRCAELVKEGIGDKILFSGFLGNWTRGLWTKSEAHIFKERALLLGLDSKKILIEDKSTNIGDNIRFCKNMLKEKDIFIQKVLFVTKPQTERRVFATVPIEWKEIDFYVTSPDTSFEDQPVKHHSMDDLINEMVGEIQRIKIYSEKGWQIPQIITADVEKAYDTLLSLGYNGHMVK